MNGLILQILGLVMSCICMLLASFGKEEDKQHNHTQALLWLLLSIVGGK